MHWAAKLIGRPWLLGAEGPRQYDCWGFMRMAVFKDHFGIEMPPIALNSSQDDNTVALKRAAQVSGWRQAVGPAQEDDVILMRGTGGRHVGIAARANRIIGVLHCNGGFDKDGRAFGSVMFQSFDDLAVEGYGDFEFWRFTPSA